MHGADCRHHNKRIRGAQKRQRHHSVVTKMKKGSAGRPQKGILNRDPAQKDRIQETSGKKNSDCRGKRGRTFRTSAANKGETLYPVGVRGPRKDTVESSQEQGQGGGEGETTPASRQEGIEGFTEVRSVQYLNGRQLQARPDKGRSGGAKEGLPNRHLRGMEKDV